jgi:hypothetical protein
VSTDFAPTQTPMWRNLVMVGVVGSVVAWALAWFLEPGPTLLMVVVALAAVGLWYRARQGTKWAWAGLIAAGAVMLFGAVYFTGLLFLGGATVTLVDWLVVSLAPMAFAVCLLLGAGPSFRHARSAA